MTRGSKCAVVAVFAGAYALSGCSKAHEARDGSDTSVEDAPRSDGRTCDRTCSPSCQDSELTCLCAGYAYGCDDYVVHCPTAVEPPECGSAGYGIYCNSGLPGGGLEEAICVRNTAPDRGSDQCAPLCRESGEIVCVDWRRGVYCDDHVVECPTAGRPPTCEDHAVTCRLPDGDLERPICVRR